MTSVTMLAYGFSTISGRRRKSLSLLQRNKGSTVCEGMQQLVGSKNRGSIKHERCSALLDAVARPQTVTGGESSCPAEHWPSGIYPCGVSLLCSVALKHRGTSHCTGKAFFKIGFIDILSQTLVMLPGDCIKTACFFFWSIRRLCQSIFKCSRNACYSWAFLVSLAPINYRKSEQHRMCIIF